jgi:tRNA(His) 5'-end guanylyltransferase
MVAAVRACVEDLHPTVAYTQSDEITLAWFVERDSLSEYPFGGRYQKLASVLASIATVGFNNEAKTQLPQKQPKATFDCRVWSVPTLEDAMDVFRWREDDAVKNSVQMLAQANFSHADLHGKHTGALLQMLESKGIVWGNEQTHFKRGIYLRRAGAWREMDEQERLGIPEKHRPPVGTKFLRSEVQVLDIPPIRKLENPLEVLFGGPLKDANGSYIDESNPNL